MNSSLIYACDCGKETLLYIGDPVNILFSRLPEAIAKAMKHKCKEPK